MSDKAFNCLFILFVVIAILYTITFVVTFNAEPSDEVIEQEKQRLYEIEKTVPKDLEQIALIEDVNISITPNDEIELTFLGDECELQVKYTTNYEKLEENFRDKREGVIGCAGAAVGACISFIFISLSIKIWWALDSSKEKRKKAKIQRQEEKIKKKQEKEKRKQKNNEIKVIQL